jgi:glycosyltransferase involved in cell wall biosynthesis
MKISAALCTYNGERFLEEQLRSIAAQTVLPMELIVYDDQSTDGTPRVIQQFAAQAPFPVHFTRNATRLGIAKNFEQAIRACSGDLIALADQDDRWQPDKLAQLRQIMETRPNVGAVFTDATLVDEHGNSLNRSLWQSIRFTQQEQQSVNQGDALPVLLKHRVVTGATLLFRASFRERVLPISELWIHDNWIAFIIALFAELHAHPAALIDYRQHTANQIGTAQDVRGEIAEAAARGRQSYAINLAQYEALVQHIQQWSDLPGKEAIQAGLESKMAHIQTRATLPDHRLKRILPVMLEFISGRYDRYSSGWRSAVKDALLK